VAIIGYSIGGYSCLYILLVVVGLVIISLMLIIGYSIGDY
jgi:hypothetical protein